MSSDTSAVIVIRMIRSSTVRTTRHRAPRTVQDRPRNVRKNKDRAASSKEMGPLPQTPPAPADHLSYNNAEGDNFLSYLEAGPSSKESSLTLMADSRSVMPGTEPHMITLLIEDRRHGTDQLAYRSQRVLRQREQTHSGPFLDQSGYETDQFSPSVVHARHRLSNGCSSDRKLSSQLQPSPTPMGGSQRIHDEVASFLEDMFMKDCLDSNEFSRDRTHMGSLSNAALLRIYWFAQGRLETWVRSRLPKHLNDKEVEIGHVLGAL
ncbi:hypothetical protein V8E52_010742 [Russula decolorans]